MWFVMMETAPFILILSFVVAASTNPPFEPSNRAHCKLPATCIDLHECKQYMALLTSSTSTTSSQKIPILKFLRARLCAFNAKEPKVCCEELPQYLRIIKDNFTSSINETKTCSGQYYECVELLQCGPLIYLLDLEQPSVNYAVIKFVKSQQCGITTNGLPKVCCWSATTTTTTEIPKTTTTTMSLKEKSRKMNELFDTSGFFDFMAFDLVRRRRREGESDEIDIEIR